MGEDVGQMGGEPEGEVVAGGDRKRGVAEEEGGLDDLDRLVCSAAIRIVAVIATDSLLDEIGGEGEDVGDAFDDGWEVVSSLVWSNPHTPGAQRFLPVHAFFEDSLLLPDKKLYETADALFERLSLGLEVCLILVCAGRPRRASPAGCEGTGEDPERGAPLSMGLKECSFAWE